MTTTEHPMKAIRVEKVTLNIGSGKEQSRLDKSVIVLKTITGIDPKKRVTKKRIAAWGLRPGLPIGCCITLRGKEAEKLLARLLTAREHTLEKRHFDNEGNVSFGILEHIDIPGVEYDPKIGVHGLQACVTLERPGFRIKRRTLHSSPIGKSHRIRQTDAIEYMQQKHKVTVKGE